MPLIRSSIRRHGGSLDANNEFEARLFLWICLVANAGEISEVQFDVVPEQPLKAETVGMWED